MLCAAFILDYRVYPSAANVKEIYHMYFVFSLYFQRF